MNYRPFVSVLMTAYNRDKYITEAIESVLASTYKNFELIIVDDASTDETVKIARKYEANDNRIRVYVNETNLGQFPNRNFAASHAQGEFFVIVDSDDTIFINGLEQIVQSIEKFPEMDFAIRIYSRNKRLELLSPMEAYRKHFFTEPFLTIGPGGTVIKSSFFKMINGFPDKYGPAGDMYYNLKAACMGRILLLPFEYTNYRRHEGQEINKKFTYLYDNYSYLNDAIHELPIPLEKNEVEWILLKNKRRFSVNLVKYFFRTFNVKKLRYAIARTNFTFGDFLQGIFHTNRLLKKKD